MTHIKIFRLYWIWEKQESELKKQESIDKKTKKKDHTADIQIQSWGGDLRETFVNAALGIIGYIVPLGKGFFVTY